MSIPGCRFSNSQLTRGDVVVRLLPGADLAGLVPGTDIGDELEGVLEVGDRRAVEPSGALDRAQSGLGVDLREGIGERIDPGEVDDEGHAAGAQVEGGDVFALLLEDEAAEEPDRWLDADGFGGQVGQEAGAGAGCRDYPSVQGVEEAGVAEDRRLSKKTLWWSRVRAGVSIIRGTSRSPARPCRQPGWSP